MDRSSLGDAFDGSNLQGVPSDARDRLLSGAAVRKLEAGSMVQVAGESRRHVHLVVSGLIRMVAHAPDGRSVAVRYCRRGSLIGIASVFAPGFTLPVSIETLTPVELLDLRPDAVAELAAAEPRVAHALLVEVSDRVQRFVEEIPLASFTTVGQRVARHLLDLAVPDERGVLVARVSQEDLAAAVGTVREVAARALRKLRDAGVVRTERNRITIIDPDALVTASTDV